MILYVSNSFTWKIENEISIFTKMTAYYAGNLIVAIYCSKLLNYNKLDKYENYGKFHNDKKKSY